MDGSLERGKQTLRREIDAIDNAILHFLGARVVAASKIAELKRQANQPLQDTAREQEHLDHVEHAAERLGLFDPHAVRQIMQAVMAYCLRVEEQGEPGHDASQVPGW